MKQKYQLASPSPSKPLTEKLQKTFPVAVSVVNLATMSTFEYPCGINKAENVSTDSKKPAVRRSLGFTEKNISTDQDDSFFLKLDWELTSL